METTKYTFWKLINEYKIEIPIIQRDYAQGRSIGKIPEIRKEFLMRLHNAIENDDENLDFDFVYGSVEEKAGVFTLLPLDGQQRLTTLFLLHWYLATKENKILEFSEVLSRFTYETRVTSREFCEALVSNPLDFEEIDKLGSLSDMIIDSHWFYLSWLKDPTIKSMLSMLDDMHEMFYDSEDFFNRLMKPLGDNAPVTFRFLELKNFGLTDNLYIKMNARGKALTDFENFKAKFNHIVGEIHPDKQMEFAVKMDNAWTDVFWPYRDNQNQTIDNSFMRYFHFITEMIFIENQESIQTTSPFLYDDNNIPKIEFEMIQSVYNNKETIEFLLKSLDFWTQINDSPDEYLSKIFSKTYEPGKLVIFDGDSNLMRRCVNGDSFGIAERLMLYALIKRGTQLEEYSISEELTDYLRIVRNLILRVRQARITRYMSNLRFENMKKQLRDIDILSSGEVDSYNILLDKTIELQGFSKESVASEKKKAGMIRLNKSLKNIIQELEDDDLFRGCIDNVIDIVEKDSSNRVLQTIREIWSEKSNLIIRAILASGDYSIVVGYSQLGARKFLGADDRWNLILTRIGSEAKRVKDTLDALLTQYWTLNEITTTEKLNQIINQFIATSTRDWRYYFVKYPTFVDKKALYAWKNDFELRKLNGDSLLAYHINPFVRAVALGIKNKSICEYNDCVGIYGELSPLKLKNGVEMEHLEKGWKVKIPDKVDSSINKQLFPLIPIENRANEYWLLETEALDRVEVAIQFAKDFTASI